MSPSSRTYVPILPIINIIHQMVRFQPGMKLPWHVIITPNSQLTLELTLGGVHFMIFVKCIMTYIHYYSIMQSSFTALKILHVLPIHLSPLRYLCPPTSGNHWSFSRLHSFAFSRLLHSWNHTVCGLFSWAFFTQSYALKVPLCPAVAWILPLSLFLALNNIPLSGCTSVIVV